MKGCLKFVVGFVLLITAASVARYYLLLTPEQRAAETAAYAAKVAAEEQAAAQQATAAQAGRARIAALQPEFIAWLQRNAGIETGRFQDGVLEVKFSESWPSKDHARVKAEALAHAWRLRSGLDYAQCAIYWGNEIYATGIDSGPVPKEHLALVLDAALKQMEEEKNAATPTAPMKMSPQEQAYRDTTALAAMQGKTLAEIEGTHGKALRKSVETGWAEFQTFRARFEKGKVAEVSVK
jgi:hypothetical protein